MEGRMNPQIKEKWLAALRSGKYVQGVGALKLNGEVTTHCCLGVLCELHMEETGEGRWVGGTIDHYECEDGTESEKVLPLAVQEWSGVETVGLLDVPYGWKGDNCLTRINDNSAKSDFSDVISAIEQYL